MWIKEQTIDFNEDNRFALVPSRHLEKEKMARNWVKGGRG